MTHFDFIPANGDLLGGAGVVILNGTSTLGDKMWTKSYVDGNTEIKWVYTLGHSNTLLFRCMMIDG